MWKSITQANSDIDLSKIYFVYLITKSQTRLLLLICQILMSVNLKDELHA